MGKNPPDEKENSGKKIGLLFRNVIQLTTRKNLETEVSIPSRLQLNSHILNQNPLQPKKNRQIRPYKLQPLTEANRETEKPLRKPKNSKVDQRYSDGLENLKKNLEQLQGLQKKFRFMLEEIEEFIQ